MKANKYVKKNLITMMLVSVLLCTACQKEKDKSPIESAVVPESEIVMETQNQTGTGDSQTAAAEESVTLYGKTGKIGDSSFTLQEVDYKSGDITGEKELLLDENTIYTISKMETADSVDTEQIEGTKADLKEGTEVTCAFKMDGDQYVAVNIFITQIG